MSHTLGAGRPQKFVVKAGGFADTPICATSVVIARMLTSDRSAQVLLLYHRQNYDRAPEALGLGIAARYFVAEVDGIDQEGTN
jgi:hypothetical protein